MNILASESTNHLLTTTSEFIKQVSENFINVHSITVFITCIVIALILGRIVAAILRKAVQLISRQADNTEDLRKVNRLRRYETILVLFIAGIRSVLLICAIYFWWMLTHPNAQPTALLGAGALTLVIVYGILTPVLRDITAGSVMMAEHWYGVGDHVKVEPFWDVQGVVERVSLRSTKIRGLNGEIIWINNQNITGVHLAPKGVRTMGLELFVTDLAAGENLISKTNRRLPIGPMLMVNPLEITSSEQVGDNLWHITAVGETAPGREWLIEQSAVELIKDLDEKSKKPVLTHGPLARYADPEADNRFKRTIKNARKRPAAKKSRTRKKSK